MYTLYIHACEGRGKREWNALDKIFYDIPHGFNDSRFSYKAYIRIHGCSIWYLVFGPYLHNNTYIQTDCGTL